MKKLLLCSLAAFALGSAAQAEVAFENGTGSFSVQRLVDGSDPTTFNADFAAAFSAGNFGFQLDGGMVILTDFSTTITLSQFGLHGYKSTANGNKFGAYTTTNSFGFIGASSPAVGVEAMFGFGRLDAEVSIGMTGINNILQASVDVYFEVSPRIELSAGYFTMFDNSISRSNYSVGAAYAFGNSGYSAFVNYISVLDVGGSDDRFGIGITWDFGPNHDNRVFSARGIDPFTFFP